MLMRECWNYEPMQRPEFSEIVEHLDRILSQTADEEYLTFNMQVLETPPSSEDESDEDEENERHLPFL